MRRLAAVEALIALAVVWLVALSRRSEYQVYAATFADHLRVTAFAMAAAAIAAAVAWIAARRTDRAPAVLYLGGAGVALAVSACRRPGLSPWVTVLVDVMWLAGAACLAGAVDRCLNPSDARSSRAIQGAIAAVVATGVYMGVGALGYLGPVEFNNARNNFLFTLALAVIAAFGCWLLTRRFARPA